MLKRITMIVVLAVSILFIWGCASSTEQGIEEARFAVDRGDWDTAIQITDDLLQDDPSNIKAALLQASAYAGRGGFRLMDLVSVISNDLHRKDIFGAIRDFFINIESLNMDDIRNAIVSLVIKVYPEPAWGHVHFIDYQFDSAILMLIESYTLPDYVAQPVVGGPIDVNKITQEIKDIVQSDMIEFDNRLIEAGVDPTSELMVNTRATYCALQRASTTEDGFDLEVLRDMVLCQLSPNDGADLKPEDFQSPNITSCTDFNYDECYQESPATEL